MAETATAATEASTSSRTYLFRGDVKYRGGPVGATLGAEADAADIQDAADHVLRKEPQFSSRYTSFTLEVRVARRFTKTTDNRHVFKVAMATLLELEATGDIKVWRPEQLFETLSAGSKKQAKQAGDVQTAMQRNSEILIEGQIPAEAIERVK